MMVKLNTNMKEPRPNVTVEILNGSIGSSVSVWVSIALSTTKWRYDGMGVNSMELPNTVIIGWSITITSIWEEWL